MKKKISLFTCLCLLMQLFVVAASASSIDQFRDVSAHWAKNYIEILCDKGVVNGYSNGTFAPNSTITKAEAAKMVCLSADITPNASVSTSISDIDNHWAKEYIAVLPSVPLQGSAFSPNAAITRAELAQMIAGALYLDMSQANADALKTKFKDWASIPADKLSYVALAVDKDIISGYDDATFRPNSSVKRGEACAMLKRAFFPNEKIKPSAYYVDTVVNADGVTNMMVAPDDTLYYTTRDNKVYRVVDGKSEQVWDGNTVTVTVPTSKILEQPKTIITTENSSEYEFSIEAIRQKLEEDTQNDTRLTFTGFHVAGTVYDQKTRKIYVLTNSHIKDYSDKEFDDDDLYILSLFEITQPLQPYAKVFYSGSFFNGLLPNGEAQIIEDNKVFYTTGYLGNLFVIKWDLSSQKVTYASSYSYDNASHILYGNNELWLLDNDIDTIFLRNVVNGEILILAENTRDINNVFSYEDTVYYWIGTQLYTISKSKPIPECLITRANSTWDPEINIKDYLNNFNPDNFVDWVIDSEGVMYFYDTDNRVIRKLYGIS